jgi:hypothetical protein
MSTDSGSGPPPFGSAPFATISHDSEVAAPWWPARGEAVLPLLALALFGLIFVVSPLADIGLLQRPLLGMVLLVVTLSGLFTAGVARPFAPAVLALGLTVFGLQTTMLLRPTGTVALLNDVAAGLFVLLLCALLLRGVMRPGAVTINRIIGAVVVYLLFALLFALLFNLVERLAPGAFTMGPEPSPLAPAGARFFYLSVITLTSVGFGDMAPVHPVARSLVMLEGMLGQIYTTVLLARLVSLEIAQRTGERSR